MKLIKTFIRTQVEKYFDEINVSHIQSFVVKAKKNPQNLLQIRFSDVSLSQMQRSLT